MRLQSAIFTMDDTLFTPSGQACEELDKALALFKMEGVWMGAVTAQSAEDAQRALERAGLAPYFRFVLTERVSLCPADSGTIQAQTFRHKTGQGSVSLAAGSIQNATDLPDADLAQAAAAAE